MAVTRTKAKPNTYIYRFDPSNDTTTEQTARRSYELGDNTTTRTYPILELRMIHPLCGCRAEKWRLERAWIPMVSTKSRVSFSPEAIDRDSSLLHISHVLGSTGPLPHPLWKEV